MTTSISDSGVTFADATVINSSAQLGMRNLLINGNYNVNQRSYATGTATTAANQYTLDRWRVITSGQSLAFTASGNGSSVTAPAGGLEQIIEGASIGITAGVINWVGTATCTVDGTAKTKGQTVTLVPGTNSSVKFFGGTVSFAQLEAGGAHTAFEFRPFSVELAMCQRYYELIFGVLSTAMYAPWPFKVTKRVTPTFVALGSTNGGTLNAGNATGTYQENVSTAAISVNFSASAEL